MVVNIHAKFYFFVVYMTSLSDLIFGYISVNIKNKLYKLCQFRCSGDARICISEFKLLAQLCSFLSCFANHSFHIAKPVNHTVITFVCIQLRICE